MPVEEKSLGGLVTNVAETQAPPGTLIEAENVVMRRPGCIEPRDGLQLAGTLASGFAAYGFSWRSKDFILRNNGSNVFNWTDTAGGTYQYADLSLVTIDPQPFRRDMFSRAEARGNLYVTYDAGVLRMETDAGPWLAAGLPPHVSIVFAAATSTSGTWLGSNEQVAYRVLAMRKDANGMVVRSPPSGAVIVANAAGVGRAVDIVFVANFTTLWDFIELYRTRNFPTSVTPDEEYQLVGTIAVAAAGASYTDLVAVANRGATLYTSPSRGGADERNNAPPAAACVALFRSSLFFANTRGPRTIKLSRAAVAVVTGSATGIGSRVYTATTTNGSANLTLLSSTVGLEKGMVITGTGIPANAFITNISGTTVTMSANATASGAGVSLTFFDAIKVLNTWISIATIDVATTIGNILNLYKVTPPESGFAVTQVIETFTRSTTARTIQATHGTEYSPPLPGFDGTPLDMEQDVSPGGISWSKPDEPEHVRPIDYGFIGDQNRAILGLVPTRDALFILKEDGIFRLTGANGVWRVDPFDPTAKCMLPGSVRAVRGRGVFLGDRGVAMVSDEGVELISSPINDLVKPVIDQIQASWLSTGFYELPGMQGAHAACVFDRESEYTLARGSTVAPLVYNDITGAWTTLAYYGHANESLSYKALFNFERAGKCVLSMGVSYFATLLSTDAGADYLRYDRATAVTVNSFAQTSNAPAATAGNATLSAPINALEDDIVKDSAGRYWRITAAVNNSATVPVVLGGGTAAMATGAGTLYRSLRCSVIATGFATPLSAQKSWGVFNAAWTKLVGVARLLYGWQSNESPGFVEQDAYTSLARTALASGSGVTNYPLGFAEPSLIASASARAWLLRGRIRWAMAHGDAQLEGISSELIAVPLPGAKQQVAA